MVAIEKVTTIADGVFITIFSMIVVFIILLIISLLIDLMKNIFVKDNSNYKIKKEEDRMTEIDMYEEEELVAVIAAAIAVSMGVEIPEIRIKTIKRIDNSWKNTARNEQVLNKL